MSVWHQRSGHLLRGRYFLRDNLQGPHLGLGLEFVHTQVDSAPDLISTKSAYFVPLFEGGYRLPVSSGFCLGSAAAAGGAFKLSTRVENMPGGSSAGAFVASDKSTVDGSASLEAGAYCGVDGPDDPVDIACTRADF